MRSTRPGVTFLEVTLVVLFIGILAAVGTPYFARATRVRNTRNAALQIADYVGYIRTVAINEGRTTSLSVDPNTDTFSSPDVDFPSQIGTRISVAVKDQHDPNLELTASFDSSLTLQFDLEGTVLANGVPLTSGTIVVQSAEATQTIVIQAGTGATSIVDGVVPTTSGPVTPRRFGHADRVCHARGLCRAERLNRRSWSGRMRVAISDRRFGYTLIELIGAMAAASLLMLTLAASVLVSTSLVEPSDADAELQRDRQILDRLGGDLRYATSIDAKNTVGGFKADRASLQNTHQTVVYQSVVDGLTRTADGTQVQLDASAPTIHHWVDGFTAATAYAAPRYVRPRAFDVSSTNSGGGTSLALDVPSNAENGDLLFLIVAFRQASSVLPSSPGWIEAASIDHDSIELVVFSQQMSAATTTSQVVSFDQVDDATAALVVIEDAGATPLTWTGTQEGTTVAGSQSTYASPLENSATIQPTSLNLQVFAAEGSPWLTHTLAMPGFSDLLVSIGSEGSADECMLAVTYRSGAIPSLTHPINAVHFEAVDWVSVSLQVDGD